MDQSEKRGANGKLQPLPRSPSSVLQKLELLEEGEALESLRLSDQGDEEACQAGEEGEEVPGSSKSNPAASQGVPAASMLAPPRPVRRQQPAYAQRASECRSSPCSAGYGQTEWHPQQPVSPVYYMPQFEAYSPEGPLGSPGTVAHPYWHYGGPFQIFPGGELGPPVPASPRSPAAGCVPPGSPCGPDYYCMGPPLSFMPGLPMPGMGGPPVVLGLNGPVPAGMMMPQYGAPPYSPGGGPPPRFFGGPPQLPAVRAGRIHRANDDLNKFRFNLAEARGGQGRTTVMIKNVPNKYTQRMLLDTFNRRFRDQYDFFYLPIDYKNKCNLGYCFINFLNAELTAECYEEFHQKRWEEFNSKKVAEVCYAKVQGQQACIDHFKNAKFPVLDLDCLPIEFRHMASGEMVAVPVSPRQQAAA